MNIARSHKNSKILLVGAGKMAQDYYKVLRDLDIEMTVFCRTFESAKNFNQKTGHEALYGDLEDLLSTKFFDKAIIAVDIENLFSVSCIVLKANIKKILVEKPGGSDTNEINKLSEIAQESGADLYVAYNRRFYSSTLKAKEIIKTDGGILSFSFEFTEWSDKVTEMNYSNKIYKNWFINNSSHVVDMAFYLCGFPKELHSQVSGKDLLPWHPSASVFYGSGKTYESIPFNYKANWAGPGRWGIEVITKRRKLILQPLEDLLILDLKSLEPHKIELSDELDTKYKPGIFLQTKSFLEDQDSNLFLIQQQKESLKYYLPMAGYS